MTNGKVRLALVDDDVSVRRALTRLLRSVGYDVKAYPSAEAFVHSCGQDEFDCALADVRMQGETGLALAAILRAVGVNIPLILMTGDIDESLPERAERAGALTLIAKPLTEAVIVRAIECAICDRAAAARTRN